LIMKDAFIENEETAQLASGAINMKTQQSAEEDDYNYFSN